MPLDLSWENSFKFSPCQNMKIQGEGVIWETRCKGKQETNAEEIKRESRIIL